MTPTRGHRNDVAPLLPLAEQRDGWPEGRRCLGVDVLAESRSTLVATGTRKGAATGLGALSD